VPAEPVDLVVRDAQLACRTPEFALMIHADMMSKAGDQHRTAPSRPLSDPTVSKAPSRPTTYTVKITGIVTDRHHSHVSSRSMAP
jgi:hypothetical protein